MSDPDSKNVFVESGSKPCTLKILLSFFGSSGSLSSALRFYPIVQRFCNAPRSLWEMPDSNPEPLSRKSGALPMSHHISKSLHMLNIPVPTVHNFFSTVEIVSRCLLFWILDFGCWMLKIKNRIGQAQPTFQSAGGNVTWIKTAIQIQIQIRVKIRRRIFINIKASRIRHSG